MKKKPAVLIFLCLLMLTGCWDQRELSSITVVTGMAVDKGKNDKYALTVEGLNAQELKGKTATGYAPSIIFTVEGKTISELSQKMNIGISRNLIYSHMKTLIISEEIGREGIMEFLDHLERNREIRDDFDIIVARKTKAADMLRITYHFQKSTALKLFTQIQSMVKNWGGDPNVKLNDVISASTSLGREPVMIAAIIKGNPKKGVSVNNMKKVLPDALVVLDSLAIFKHGKLKGFLPLTDARNYLWIDDDINRTSISVPCGKNKYFAVQVYNSKTRKKVRMSAYNKPLIQVDVRSEAYLDAEQCSGNMREPETYKRFENLAEKQIKKELLSTIQKVQRKFQSDIFGFGDNLFQQHYQQFKKVKTVWDEKFSEAIVDVNVKVKIRRSGIRTKKPTER